ncbi:TetR/AcrR family transcriptional regulator [Sphingobacterium hotanense]|uniref:TetR/AcrR family transcriptional regulator n=2 Tax=Sphingobacterium hotanense TaxID=649196 RepID=A0ABT7NMB8_9SPHI|nr:TetR/AcrR family transcriptional regulator [Sphingobacterium hotanense]
MEMKDKKQKHKEDLKLAILEAAKKLFVQEGYEATSIRKIAKEIEFSPTTIYLYYKDKNDIVYALHQEGFQLLRQQFMALDSVDDPFQRFKALGRNYIDFAFRNPDYYQVMFMMKEPMEFLDANCIEEQWPEGERVFDFLRLTIAQCQEQGWFKDKETDLVAFQAWSAVHGLVTLYLSNHLSKITDTLEMQYTVRDLVNKTFEVYVSFIEQTK